MAKIGLIWAQTLKGVIGAKNKLPWRLPEDLRHFSKITKHQTVIMGRNTWESLPSAYKPLPDRVNIIITSQKIDVKKGNVIVVSSLEEALSKVETEWAWIIGGGQLYSSTIHLADRLEVTWINLPSVHGDTFAPEIPINFIPEGGQVWNISLSNIPYAFASYINRNKL